MTGLLLGPEFAESYAAELDGIEQRSGVKFERIVLARDPDARLSPEELARVRIAHFSSDIFPDFSAPFFSAVYGATELEWLHIFNTGTDHPVFQGLLEKGVVLTNSRGANAVPIAQSAITGLLMLSRGFTKWGAGQREKRWENLAVPPVDLEDQTMVVLGTGAIGGEIARLGRELGLHVIGVRRSPPAAGDPLDECVTPQDFLAVLPRADWLAVACPLTEDTRGMVSAEALAALPEGARVLNIGRGEVIDEPALVKELESNRLGGAYLDVFATEPLPEDSPLWTHPEVIVTPHNSGSSAGAPRRQTARFLENLERWATQQPLLDRVG